MSLKNQLQVALLASSGWFFCHRIKGQIMNASLEILLIKQKSGVSRTTGKPYTLNEAHCVVRGDDGVPSGVGTLLIPNSFVEVPKPGLYSATFQMVASTYGESAGKISAELCTLTPMKPLKVG